jgi:hypothetical protein
MSEEAFQKYYAALTDDQLEQVQIDRKDLVPEALSALDREVKRRHLRPSEPPRWIRQPNSDEQIQSLEDCYDYQRLQRKKRFMDKFWYLLAFGPVVLLVLSEKYAYKDPENIGLSLGWVILILGYWVFQKLRLTAYTCPECAQRFGDGVACFRCGFPRSSGQRK